MGVCQYCKHKWTIVAKQFIVLYLRHNRVKSRLKVYYRAQPPGGKVCSIISGHVIATLCRKKTTLGTVSTPSGESRESAGAGFTREDQLMNRAAWLQTNTAADTELHFCDAPTTTLPSEGHQNVLVNAAFVLPREGALGPGCVCTAPTTARAGLWCGGVERADGIFQRGCCTPACFTFGLTRCESLQRGGHCPKGYYRWNVAHGGWTAVERSRRRWMHAWKKNGPSLANVWIKWNENK